jgi:hypothetical protein
VVSTVCQSLRHFGDARTGVLEVRCRRLMWLSRFAAYRGEQALEVLLAGSTRAEVGDDARVPLRRGLSISHDHINVHVQQLHCLLRHLTNDQELAIFQFRNRSSNWSRTTGSSDSSLM